MSQLSTPFVVPGAAIDVVRGLKTAIVRMAMAVHGQRQAHAKRLVRSIIASRSDEELARYGWSAEDIRRLKYE